MKKQKIKILEPWEQYEIEVFKLFCSTGYVCQHNVVLQGVRGSHQIDIVVNVNDLPTTHLWIVECKYWSHPVTKHEVLSLKSIIEDIGASHGFLLSEVGFQSGAHKMARLQNISLISQSELQSHLIQKQLNPHHQQTNNFVINVEEIEDLGNFDSEAIIKFKSIDSLSVLDSLLEVHIFRENIFHWVIPLERIKKNVNDKGQLCFSLPWDLRKLCDVEFGGEWGIHTKSGVPLWGTYNLVFRTLSGPLFKRTYVPIFK